MRGRVTGGTSGATATVFQSDPATITPVVGTLSTSDGVLIVQMVVFQKVQKIFKIVFTIKIFLMLSKLVTQLTSGEMQSKEYCIQ